jgi:hypothetical protein
VGYIRETPDPQEGDAGFAQAERIRRWVNDKGHRLVAVCQDVRALGHPLGREGYQALVGIVAAGQVDAVVVPNLETLSPDKVIQEVMVWDLRRRGVAVLSTGADELPLLENATTDHIRMLVRDVLAKADRHHALVGTIGATEGEPTGPTILRVDEASDVIVELIPATRVIDGPERVRPAR